MTMYGNYRVCAARTCHNKVNLDEQKLRQGPMFCSKSCEKDFLSQNPYYAPSITGDEITEQLAAFNEEQP